MDTPNYSSFENIIISISVSCRTLLLASIYRPPGPCSSIFLDEFMSLVCFLSSVGCNYFTCCDFDIYVDVLCTDSYQLESLLESCNLTQSVNNTTHLHSHILDLILSPVIKICVYMLTSVNSYLIMQSLNVLLTFLSLLLTVKQEFPIGGTIV